MKSHEVFQEAFKEDSVKELAGRLGMTPSALYKWSRQDDDRMNPLERMAWIVRAVQNPRLMHWLCAEAGGYFVHNPAVKKGKPLPLSPAQNKVVHDFAQMLALIAKESANGKICKDAKNIRKRWEALKSLMEYFVACCEKGTFEPQVMDAAIHAHMAKTKGRK